MKVWGHCHTRKMLLSGFGEVSSLGTMAGMEMLFFNIQDGFLESIVRGHRTGLLTVPDYNNLCQCENLEDIKLNLVGKSK